MADINPKILALAKHLDIEVNSPDANIVAEKYNYFAYGREEYLVCTDDEANDLWEESLNNYIDECIMPELPEIAQRYFDWDGWKRDAKFDGRGHSLSGYDGEEHEVSIGDTTYYIYRIN